MSIYPVRDDFWTSSGLFPVLLQGAIYLSHSPNQNQESLRRIEMPNEAQPRTEFRAEPGLFSRSTVGVDQTNSRLLDSLLVPESGAAKLPAGQGKILPSSAIDEILQEGSVESRQKQESQTGQIVAPTVLPSRNEAEAPVNPVQPAPVQERDPHFIYIDPPADGTGDGRASKPEIVVPVKREQSSVGQQLNGIVHNSATLFSSYKAFQFSRDRAETRLTANLDNPSKLVRPQVLSEFNNSRNSLLQSVESKSLEADTALAKLVAKKPNHFTHSYNVNGEYFVVPNAEVKGLSGANLRLFENSRELGELKHGLNLDPKSMTAIKNRPSMELLNRDGGFLRHGLDKEAAAYEAAADKLVQRGEFGQKRLLNGFRRELFSNGYVLASSFAINTVVDNTVLSGSKTGVFTYGADILSPFILATGRHPLIKLGVMTGSHLLGKAMDNRHSETPPPPAS